MNAHSRFNQSAIPNAHWMCAKKAVVREMGVCVFLRIARSWQFNT